MASWWHDSTQHLSGWGSSHKKFSASFLLTYLTGQSQILVESLNNSRIWLFGISLIDAVLIYPKVPISTALGDCNGVLDSSRKPTCMTLAGGTPHITESHIRCLWWCSNDF